MEKQRKNIEMMNEISYKYQYYSEYLARKEFSGVGENDEEDEALAFIDRVYHAYMKLNNTEKEIIQNEFFYKDDVYWWKEKYDGVQFRLLYNSAINRFLNFYSRL